MEEAGLFTYTAVDHQGMFQYFDLTFQEPLCHKASHTGHGRDIVEQYFLNKKHLLTFHEDKSIK